MTRSTIRTAPRDAAVVTDTAARVTDADHRSADPVGAGRSSGSPTGGGPVGEDPPGRRAPLRWAALVAATVADLRRAGERGATTAEYAMATLAACGFAGVLGVVLRSPEVRALLTGLVKRALATG